MRIRLSELKRAIRQVIVESDQWKGVLPDDLWSLGDWEDARDLYPTDEQMDAYFMQFTREQIEMKIEQIQEEIQYEMDNMDDPQNQYDMAVAPKESLLFYLKDEILPLLQKGE